MSGTVTLMKGDELIGTISVSLNMEARDAVQSVVNGEATVSGDTEPVTTMFALYGVLIHKGLIPCVKSST